MPGQPGAQLLIDKGFFLRELGGARLLRNLRCGVFRCGTSKLQDTSLQGLEPEGTKHLGDRVSVNGAAFQIFQGCTNVDVGQEPIELSVPDCAIFLLAEIGTDNTGNLLGMLKDPLQRSVLGDPFHSGLLADLVNPHKVVASFPHECCDVGVFMRGHTVSLLHSSGGIPLELSYPSSAGVQDSHALVHQLEGVAVA